MRRAALLVLIAASCVSPAEDDSDLQLTPLPAPGKEDGQYHAGLPTNVDASRTGVWKVTAQWEDKDPQTGKTWDERYGEWIDSFEWTPGVDGWSTTYKLTTPEGKVLPAPQLECAETALFLRIAFASWHGLPLQLEATDGHQRIYFGHFGIRTASGRYAGMPEFAVRYKDYTGADLSKGWPHDANLRTRIIHGGEDTQPELGDGATFGTYADEVFLNKRTAYFTLLALDYLGSANLADSANTYNLQPDAVRAGDILLERWQANGIGHTLVVKDVTPAGTTSLDVTLVSGSMPRRQGVKASGAASKEYFTGDYTGGPGYGKLGGGLKRFRVAKARNGYWTNTWVTGDEAHWINSTDIAAIEARPARFEQLLGEVPLDQQKTELLAQIADARHHLSQYPASCAAREQRENAFRALYDVEERLEQKSPSQVDADQRKLEDYVFAPLDYSHSMTCCWDSSTSAMYDIIMAEAEADKAAADAAHVCTAPVVFETDANGTYKRWVDYAASINRAADWRSYKDDESCNLHADTLGESAATPYCSM